jgi:hypothetical protein
VGRAFGIRLTTSAALALLLTVEANAQYFGRNKVQYDRDNVRVFATEHFDVYYSVEDAAAAQVAGRMAERWHARLSKVFDHTLRGRQPLVLYGSHRRFEQTNVYGGLIDESTGGFTDARKRRIVLPFAASLGETDHVLGHEIVHAFQFDIADQHRSPLFLPLWFIEGMAEYLTLGPDDPQTAMWMRDAASSRNLPALRELSSQRYFPYRWGAAVWSHLVERFGDDLPARSLRAKRDVKRRLEALTGESLDDLTEAWHAALRERYGHERTDASHSPPIAANRAGGGRLNLAASLSPDGQRMIFLSERDQFSIDLYLADAATGRVIRKLITTAASAEFESLQYLQSAGAWDAAGSRFALATISRGKPSLLILDVDRGRTAAAVPLPQVDEVYSPTWSSGGDTIAFAAMKGGMTDLFLVTLATGDVRQLTHDAYADVQPAWSPDGRRIAFATDRFTTNLTRLTFGSYRIAFLDVESGAISAAPGIVGTHHLDPAWGPEGASLYFVSDPSGVSNVFRLDFSSGEVHQLTDVDTGVSGVTRLSPMLSVASATGTIAYGVFRDSGYEIHRIDSEDGRAGTRVEPVSATEPPAVNAIDLAASSIELVPPLPAFAVAGRGPQKPYSPKLSLEGVGSPYVSGGGGPFGSYVAGGASLLFGDLLGDQQLVTAVYVSSQFDESAFGALYVNRSSRWNWGATLEQTPELRLRTTGIEADPDRERITRERDRLLWTNRQVGGFVAYPLDRSRRLEFSAGMRQITFERERRTEVISLESGKVVEQDRQPFPSEPSVGMAEAGVALIGDTAIFGATGPMLGTRYRLQTTTAVGGLKYTSVLADYRRYLMPVRPFTLAVRIVHTGRYGPDAADFRMRDSYVGSSSLVRGYGASTVARSECPSGSANCPALNTLLVNRLVATKIELRVPLLSTLTGTSRVRYGPLPMDAFVFADAGAGWGGEQRFGPGDEDGLIVRSVGAGVRVNVFGLIFEAATLRPLDLKRSGWTMAFNLRPGF